jgi:hypothetical protein
MAPRFQNGLQLGESTTHLLFRYVVEFATQILGWTLYDNDDAGFASTQAAAADLATDASDPSILDFSGAAYTLTGSEVGWVVTMLGNAGWSASEKQTVGMYNIISVDTTAQTAKVDIKHGVHENGLPLSKSSITYRLWDPATNIPGNTKFAVIRSAYLHTPAEPNMDVRFQTWSSGTYLGQIDMGPFGTWNSGTNAWNDSRNTAQLRPHGSPSRTWDLFAYGDETDNDHFVIGIRDRERNEFQLMYIGAITPTQGTGTDTNPGVIGWGWGDDQGIAMGPGLQGILNNMWRWMAYNSGGNDVSVTGYGLVPAEINFDTKHLFRENNQWSQWSHGIYRVEIMLQCLTSSHMEARGVPKSLRFGGRIPNLTPFGPGPTPVTNYLLHMSNGLSIPWNGSKVHTQWDF